MAAGAPLLPAPPPAPRPPPLSTSLTAGLAGRIGCLPRCLVERGTAGGGAIAASSTAAAPRPSALPAQRTAGLPWASAPSGGLPSPAEPTANDEEAASAQPRAAQTRARPECPIAVAALRLLPEQELDGAGRDDGAEKRVREMEERQEELRGDGRAGTQAARGGREWGWGWRTAAEGGGSWREEGGGRKWRGGGRGGCEGGGGGGHTRSCGGGR